MNQPINKSSANIGGAATTATTLGGVKPSVAVRKSNPCDLLKNLKTIDKSKQKKPTILEQAAQDWNKCKVEENLEDELKQATKSKGGYLDKQSFLERSDLRQFEKEREIRDRARARTSLNRN